MKNETLAEAFLALYQLVIRLRAPDGCPWDAKQTKETLAGYLLEEAYEVVEAVEQGEPQAICEELGDLLFQIVFLAYLAEEKKEFDLQQVIERIQAKMIRRHPHVFGPVKVANAAEVVDNWARIKKDEKGAAATLNDIPKNLPALLASQQILKRTRETRSPDHKPEDLWGVLERGIPQIRAMRDRTPDQAGLIIGEWLFLLAQIAWQSGLSAEHLLRAQNQRILAELKEAETKNK
ncbi:MAG: MazG family protein [Desulfobacteraceae bacterium]|nr:MAG: MazG family protein [Desulfobacteraceae bacterium]